MFLIEVLLPLVDNEGDRFPKEALDRVRDELAERFGGVTAFLRTPAVGLWADESGTLRRDDVVIVEVMTKELDSGWWKGYRHELEQRFKQEKLILRAQETELL